MHVGRIRGSTRTLYAPENWDKEKNGPCVGLPILDIILDSGLKGMGSVWFPTPEEIKAIEAGAPIQLWVVGEYHPAVVLTIGEKPE